MALFRTGLERRKARLDRWAALRFNLEHPWEEGVEGFLAEHDLEPTEFAPALGTIGGGNHFAELQAIEKVLDADEFKKLDLGQRQLVVLVHSGSRGFGESILRAQVDQHFGEGAEADSFAAEEYLRGHDLAVRWAKANRELIARRFVATLGAEAECVWDGCHNSITRVGVPSPVLTDTLSPSDGERDGVRGSAWIHRKGAARLKPQPRRRTDAWRCFRLVVGSSRVCRLQVGSTLKRIGSVKIFAARGEVGR